MSVDIVVVVTACESDSLLIFNGVSRGVLNLGAYLMTQSSGADIRFLPQCDRLQTRPRFLLV
jgi:hypothetical protein